MFIVRFTRTAIDSLLFVCLTSDLQWLSLTPCCMSCCLFNGSFTSSSIYWLHATCPVSLTNFVGATGSWLGYWQPVTLYSWLAEERKFHFEWHDCISLRPWYVFFMWQFHFEWHDSYPYGLDMSSSCDSFTLSGIIAYLYGLDIDLLHVSFVSLFNVSFILSGL